ncbi:MAG TPA: hypothetical protein VFF12_11270, partial [Myxococcaceae bacterium]|nr:hypothetical protein [Myxococcaceae bacterium]
MGELARVGQELRNRYGRDYEVIEVASARDAAGVLGRLASSEQPVALVLAAQWMQPTGTQILASVRALHPIARRGLLVDWGDRSVNQPLLEAMSMGSVDYFVLKPRV